MLKRWSSDVQFQVHRRREKKEVRQHSRGNFFIKKVKNKIEIFDWKHKNIRSKKNMMAFKASAFANIPGVFQILLVYLEIWKIPTASRDFVNIPDEKKTRKKQKKTVPWKNSIVRKMIRKTLDSVDEHAHNIPCINFNTRNFRNMPEKMKLVSYNGFLGLKFSFHLIVCCQSAVLYQFCYLSYMCMLLFYIICPYKVLSRVSSLTRTGLSVFQSCIF